MIAYADIEADYAELRDFILNDVDRIVALETGGNYAAAALIACAHESLAKVQARKAHDTFTDTLPDAWQPVAPSLFDALRNGIVHRYVTKAVVVDGTRIEINISWREKPHLNLDKQDGVLYLNVPTMAAQLRGAFDAYEIDLRANEAACRRFVERHRKARESYPQGAELAAWRQLLAQR